MSSITVKRIPTSKSENVWVVRSGEDAEYYDHFHENKVIAIGHTKKFFEIKNVKEGVLSSDEAEKLSSAYKAYLLQKSPDKKGVASRQAGQVRKFATIKINDTVITITKKKVLIGRVTSHCFYDKTPLRIKNNEKECYFPLRYQVSWGTPQSREHLPYIVDKSLRNSGTVFSLTDEHQLKALNHWLSPIQFLDSEVRCSIRIGTKKEISNRPITNLSIAYQQLELLANYLEVTKLQDATPDSFRQYIEANISNYRCELTTQQSFMSPGYQFFQLKGSLSKNTIFVLGLAGLLNVNVVFADEASDTNSKQLQDKVVELVTNVVKTPEIQESISSVKATMQRQMVYDKGTSSDDFEEPTPSDDTML